MTTKGRAVPVGLSDDGSSSYFSERRSKKAWIQMTANRWKKTNTRSPRRKRKVKEKSY
jgi:hypothetical protein